MIFMGVSLLFVGSFMSLVVDSPLLWWVGLELSTLGFFAVMANQNTKAEALLKIFVVQSLAALLFLWSSITLYTSDLSSGSVVIAAAVLKLGIAPFVHWVPSVTLYLTWVSIFCFFTLLKLPVLMVLTGTQWLWGFSLLALATGVYGCFLGSASSSSVLFITASSLAHMGWLVIGASFDWGVSYLAMYTVTLAAVLYQIHLSDFIPLVVLSLAAFPPALLFFPKVMILSSLTPTTWGLWLAGALVATSLGGFMFYLKYVLSSEGTYVKGQGLQSLILFMSGGLLLFS